MEEQYTFDPQSGLLTNQKAIRNGTDLLNLDYSYNRGGSVGSLNGKTGHLTKIVDNLNNNKNREYDFDALGRLKASWGGPNKSLSVNSYAYDRYGNRTTVYVNGIAADGNYMPRDGIANLSFDNTSNRITTTGFEYDAAGNQTRALAEDGVTWLKFEYDAANRISVVKRDDGPQTTLQWFHYGSTNARVMDYDSTLGYIKISASVGGTTLAEYTEFQSATPTWTKTYTYLGRTQLATLTPNGGGGETTEFNHPDRLGTRTITNQQTGGSSEQAHLPFGTALNGESTITNNNKRFTSYDRSAVTGLDYAINRTYDSKQGRFTQVDPIGMEATSFGAPQTLNLYTYCGNDPVNRVDPSGLFWGWLRKFFSWIINTIRTSKLVRRIVVRFVVSFVMSGGNLGVAVRSIVPDILAALGLAPPRYAVTPSWNPDLPYPVSFGGIGSLSRYIIHNYILNSRNRFPCPPTFMRMVAQFSRLLLDLFENQSGHQTSEPLENGGWIYQRTNGTLFFVRADNASKLGGTAVRARGSMNLLDPPKIRGARVVGKAHTHPYTPYEQDLISSGRAYGGPSGDDFNNSLSQQMPSIVVHQIGVIDGRRNVAFEVANPAVHALPDRNCSGGQTR